LTIDRVPAEDALNLQFLHKMLHHTDSSSNMNTQYALFHEWGARGVQEISTHEEDYEQAQHSGTCSAQCILALMRESVMRNSPGSPAHRLGIYKLLKAIVLEELCKGTLEKFKKLRQKNPSSALRLIAALEKKRGKYQNDLYFFSVAAEHFTTDPENGTVYEYFSSLRKAAKFP
jgi:hypothetical protein